MKNQQLKKLDDEIKNLRGQISDTQTKANERIAKLEEKIEKLNGQKDTFWLNLLKSQKLDTLNPDDVLASLQQLKPQSQKNNQAPEATPLEKS